MKRALLFQRLIALKCLKCQKTQKISIPSLGGFLSSEPNFTLRMYNSLIFINFISRSKKVKPKMLTCVWRLCNANKLLRLWHFFYPQLKIFGSAGEKALQGHSFFRPFYIGAPKGPFLWGLIAVSNCNLVPGWLQQLYSATWSLDSSIQQLLPSFSIV